ncbi:hypothetical protein EYF80_005287 [Liparis tanakae]|uniref:Uncharacterized protein n=1 Tax=Liparis tanakae TaxID=230148 RepID=A0A4Z2J3J5_9TELE|nr:hypothetical protein EYF80_005287 [Liparis tanakae]
MGRGSPIRSAFLAAGALYLLAGAASLAPLLWNLSLVATNQTVRFPPQFKMPPAPDSQHMGRASSWGWSSRSSPGSFSVTEEVTAPGLGPLGGSGGEDNLAFESQDHL